MTADLRPTSYPGVMLRSTSDNDSEQLYRLFTASRTDLMTAIADWDEVQQNTFMHFQFKTQQDQYHNNFPEARFDVIIEQGNIIGNLYIAELDKEIRLVDIALLPKKRNLGIGQSLLQDLLDESTGLFKPMILHVQQGNPAFYLYQRLGFIVTDEQDIYRRMEWQPSSSSTYM